MFRIQRRPGGIDTPLLRSALWGPWIDAELPKSDIVHQSGGGKKKKKTQRKNRALLCESESEVS